MALGIRIRPSESRDTDEYSMNPLHPTFNTYTGSSITDTPSGHGAGGLDPGGMITITWWALLKLVEFGLQQMRRNSESRLKG